MKGLKITHWVFTGLLSALFLFSASMCLFTTEDAQVMYGILGFPAWLVFPLGIAKVLGVVMVLTKFKTWLTNWAYAGFVFDLLLALKAHLAIGDGQHMGAVIGLVLVIGSFSTWLMMTKQP